MVLAQLCCPLIKTAVATSRLPSPDAEHAAEAVAVWDSAIAQRHCGLGLSGARDADTRDACSSPLRARCRGRGGCTLGSLGCWQGSTCLGARTERACGGCPVRLRLPCDAHGFTWPLCEPAEACAKTEGTTGPAPGAPRRARLPHCRAVALPPRGSMESLLVPRPPHSLSNDSLQQSQSHYAHASQPVLNTLLAP